MNGQSVNRGYVLIERVRFGVSLVTNPYFETFFYEIL